MVKKQGIMREPALFEINRVLGDFPYYEKWLMEISERINSSVVITIADDILLNRMYKEYTSTLRLLNEYPEFLTEAIELIHSEEGMSIKKASEEIGVSYERLRQAYNKFLLELANVLGVYTG